MRQAACVVKEGEALLSFNIEAATYRHRHFCLQCRIKNKQGFLTSSLDDNFHFDAALLGACSCCIKHFQYSETVSNAGSRLQSRAVLQGAERTLQAAPQLQCPQHCRIVLTGAHLGDHLHRGGQWCTCNMHFGTGQLRHLGCLAAANMLGLCLEA